MALQIKHRESVDFDIFLKKATTLPLKQKIFKGFHKNMIKTLVDTADELTIILDNEIKITLLNYFWPPLFSLIKHNKMLPLLSIKDIATTKAYSLGRRENYRDYFDLYAIINGGFASLKEIIRWSTKKYGEIFSERMFLEQLTYLSDIKEKPNLRFLAVKYISPSSLTNFFHQRIKEIL